MPRTITLIGARGGQGTTTIAAALALFAADAQPTTLVSADPTATAALLGVPLPLAGEWAQVTPTLTLTPGSPKPGGPEPATAVTVIDAGTSLAGFSSREPADAMAPESGPGERYVVLRGPCYVALATLLASPGPPPDGIIVVAEPGRSLTARDVTDVADIPVVAIVRATPVIARTIDAGLLVARAHRIAELATLRPLAAAPPPTLAACQPAPSPLKTVTDLHWPKVGQCARRRPPEIRCRVRPSTLHIGRAWTGYGDGERAEHRAPSARGRRLLPR